MKEIDKTSRFSFSLKNSSEFCRQMAEKGRAAAKEQGIEAKPTPSPFSKDDQNREIMDLDLILADRKKDEQVKAFCEHQGNMNKRLNMGNFPLNRSREMVLNGEVRGTDSYKTCLYALRSCRWVFISGTVGTGKTTIAMQLSVDWMNSDHSRQAHFISLSRYINNLFLSKDSVDFGEISKGDLRAIKGHTVVIDDFDKFKTSEWINIQVFNLIDYLETKGKRVIFTSNKTLAEILKQDPEDQALSALVDRIKGNTTPKTEPMVSGIQNFKHQSYRG